MEPGDEFKVQGAELALAARIISRLSDLHYLLWQRQITFEKNLRELMADPVLSAAPAVVADIRRCEKEFLQSAIARINLEIRNVDNLIVEVGSDASLSGRPSSLKPPKVPTDIGGITSKPDPVEEIDENLRVVLGDLEGVVEQCSMFLDAPPGTWSFSYSQGQLITKKRVVAEMMITCLKNTMEAHEDANRSGE